MIVIDHSIVVGSGAAARISSRELKLWKLARATMISVVPGISCDGVSKSDSSFYVLFFLVSKCVCLVR